MYRKKSQKDGMDSAGIYLQYMCILSQDLETWDCNAIPADFRWRTELVEELRAAARRAEQTSQLSAWGFFSNKDKISGKGCAWCRHAKYQVSKHICGIYIRMPGCIAALWIRAKRITPGLRVTFHNFLFIFSQMWLQDAGKWKGLLQHLGKKDQPGGKWLSRPPALPKHWCTAQEGNLPWLPFSLKIKLVESYRMARTYA